MHLTSEGVWKDVKDVKENIEKVTAETAESKMEVSSHNENWFDQKEIKDWILSEPDITDIDLRPYYYACKEKIDYFAGRSESSDLSEIIDILQSSDMVIARHEERIKALTDLESEQVFDIIEQKTMGKGNFSTEPKGMEGLRKLVQHKICLRKKLAEFIARLPKTEVGPWVTKGWNKAIPSECKEHAILDQYFDKLEKEGNYIVQRAVKSLKRKDTNGYINS